MCISTQSDFAQTFKTGLVCYICLEVLNPNPQTSERVDFFSRPPIEDRVNWATYRTHVTCVLSIPIKGRLWLNQRCSVVSNIIPYLTDAFGSFYRQQKRRMLISRHLFKFKMSHFFICICICIFAFFCYPT